jgi:hypothetical protein
MALLPDEFRGAPKKAVFSSPNAHIRHRLIKIADRDRTDPIFIMDQMMVSDVDGQTSVRQFIFFHRT